MCFYFIWHVVKTATVSDVVADCCRLLRFNPSDNIRNVPRSLWCFSHSNPISFISELICHSKRHLATMLRLRPESGVQMQLQLNLA